MKRQTLDAISYSFDMLSFVFQNPSSRVINAIYLFGSSVRGELHKKSDIDIFVDCDPKYETVVRQCVDSGIVKFSGSGDFKKWRLYKFCFPFAVQIGELRKWQLRTSIASQGLLLYSKTPPSNPGQRSIIYALNFPKSKSDYIRIRRILFGRDESYYKGHGLIQSIGGKKLSANVFIVPQTSQPAVSDTLIKNKIDFSMMEVVLQEV